MRRVGSERYAGSECSRYRLCAVHSVLWSHITRKRYPSHSQSRTLFLNELTAARQDRVRPMQSGCGNLPSRAGRPTSALCSYYAFASCNSLSHQSIIIPSFHSAHQLRVTSTTRPKRLNRKGRRASVSLATLARSGRGSFPLSRQGLRRLDRYHDHPQGHIKYRHSTTSHFSSINLTW